MNNDVILGHAAVATVNPLHAVCLLDSEPDWTDFCVSGCFLSASLKTRLACHRIHQKINKGCFQHVVVFEHECDKTETDVLLWNIWVYLVNIWSSDQSKQETMTQFVSETHAHTELLSDLQPFIKPDTNPCSHWGWSIRTIVPTWSPADRWHHRWSLLIHWPELTRTEGAQHLLSSSGPKTPPTPQAFPTMTSSWHHHYCFCLYEKRLSEWPLTCQGDPPHLSVTSHQFWFIVLYQTEFVLFSLNVYVCSHVYYLVTCYHLFITCSSSGHHLVVTWLPPGYHVVITWSSPGYYLFNTWLPGHHLVTTCSTPGYYLVITCASPGYYLVIIWLPGHHPLVCGALTYLNFQSHL